MILERSILKEHVAPFLAAFCVITFLFAINYLINLLDSVLSKGLPFGLLLEVMVLSLAEIIVANSGDMQPAFQISFGLAVAAAALLTVLGMAAGLAPAIRAMNIKPVDAMRDE